MKKYKSKLFAFILLLCLTFVTTISTSASPALENGHEYYYLTILHTNDFHGRLNDLPEYSTIVKEVRSNTDNVILVDAGDLFIRGPLQKYQGIVETEILNAMDYDALVLGNHEFNVPYNKSADACNKQIKRIADKGTFATLCANVTMKSTGKYIDGVEPYTVIDVNGIDIGIIGVTSEKPDKRNKIEVSDKNFTYGPTVVENILPEVQGKSDVAIVLSHCGYTYDFDNAMIPGISAVIGGDTHKLLKKPVYTSRNKQRSAPIVQTGGEYNHHLGRLDLTFQKNDGEWELYNSDGFLYNVSGVKSDPKIENILNKYGYYNN